MYTLPRKQLTLTQALNIFRAIENEGTRFEILKDWIPLIKNIQTCYEWFGANLFESKVYRYRLLRLINGY